MDLAPCQRAWPQTGAWETQPQPLTRGTNNLMYRVETTTGAYALRIAGAQVSERRLRFEYDILSQLDAARLPFSLPLPLLTAQGDCFARIAFSEAEVCVTLTPFIPGEHPRGDDLAQAVGAGEALGLLDAALATVIPAEPADALDWRSTGDLAHCHPLVPEPRAAIGELLFPAESLARLVEEYDALLVSSALLYASLPRQLSHEDVDTSNVLMVSEHVTGVLDFEFCALDLRPMDLVVALTWWPAGRFGSGDEWPIIAALLRGYARQYTLAPAEVAAIPTLFHLRAYTSLIHRLGRYRQGLSPLEHVIARASAALERSDWLRANGERLTQQVDEALRHVQ